MADLLRLGNKMLNLACPVCNNPVFRNNKGMTFCPTCNREILIVNDKDKIKKNNIIKKDKISSTNKRDNLNLNKKIDILNLLEKVIYQKLETIISKLENETQVQVIETYTKIILNFFDLLNRISVLIESK